MKKIASTKISIAFVITLVVLAINAIVAYQSISSIDRNNRAQYLSDESGARLNQMLLSLQNIELGQREYFLTNSNPRYLNDRQSDVAKLRTDLTELRWLKATAEKATFDRKFDRLAVEIDRQLDRLSDSIDKRQAQILAPAERIALTDIGRSAIERIRQIVTSLEATEQKTLARLQRESQQSLVDTKLAFGIAGLLDLLLLISLFGLVNWDLTKRQQAESQLKEYARDFAALYHEAPCGYHSIDERGIFVRINRAALEMLGYQEDEIVGCKSLIEILTPESVPTFVRKLEIVKHQGWLRDLELQMVCKDGRIVPVSISMVASYDRDGNYIGSRSTVIDIRERAYLQQRSRLTAEISQKIRQSLQLEDILQTVVDEVQQLLVVDRVLIFQLQPDGGGTVVRERVLPGYPVVMGSQIVDPCFDRADRAKFAHGHIHAVADITKAGFMPCYVEFLQQFAVRASAIVPIICARDELWGLLIVHQCQSLRQWQTEEVEILSQLSVQIGIAISQSQLLEQEQIQRQELARSNAELEQFAHIASHDLQEPLRMVIGYLQLLERRYRGQLDADADEFIHYAVDGATRMQSLIQALLGYARLSSRKRPFATVDVNACINDAIANLQLAAIESNAEISCEPLPAIWGDATQLTQLFQNLIGNAIKFRQPDLAPQIQISCREIYLDRPAQRIDLNSPPSAERLPIAGWQFAIADNGIGIESQYLERIFVIFQRLHTRATYPGTGMGLAICKKIVERHGGTMWAESRWRSLSPTDSPQAQTNSLVSVTPGGSIFYFTIPALPPNADRHAHSRPSD